MSCSTWTGPKLLLMPVICRRGESDTEPRSRPRPSAATGAGIGPVTRRLQDGNAGPEGLSPGRRQPLRSPAGRKTDQDTPYLAQAAFAAAVVQISLALTKPSATTSLTWGAWMVTGVRMIVGTSRFPCVSLVVLPPVSTVPPLVRAMAAAAAAAASFLTAL